VSVSPKMTVITHNEKPIFSVLMFDETFVSKLLFWDPISGGSLSGRFVSLIISKIMDV
jgi:hypothetical protein